MKPPLNGSGFPNKTGGGRDAPTATLLEALGGSAEEQPAVVEEARAWQLCLGRAEHSHVEGNEGEKVESGRARGRAARAKGKVSIEREEREAAAARANAGWEGETKCAVAGENGMRVERLEADGGKVNREGCKKRASGEQAGIRGGYLDRGESRVRKAARSQLSP